MIPQAGRSPVPTPPPPLSPIGMELTSWESLAAFLFQEEQGLSARLRHGLQEGFSKEQRVTLLAPRAPTTRKDGGAPPSGQGRALLPDLLLSPSTVPPLPCAVSSDRDSRPHPQLLSPLAASQAPHSHFCSLALQPSAIQNAAGLARNRRWWMSWAPSSDPRAVAGGAECGGLASSLGSAGYRMALPQFPHVQGGVSTPPTSCHGAWSQQEAGEQLWLRLGVSVRDT